MPLNRELKQAWSGVEWLFLQVANQSQMRASLLEGQGAAKLVCTLGTSGMSLFKSGLGSLLVTVS